MPGPHDTIEFWLKVVGVIGALFALSLTWRTHAERATFEMIDRLYTLCHTLEGHALRDWYLAHLFCVGTTEYESAKKSIKESIQKRVEKEPGLAAEYLVKEKLFATHVFISYEQVFYQYRNTTRGLHHRRRRFLRGVLSYFTDRLISQNPRLLALSQMDPSGVSLHLEYESSQYLKNRIQKLQLAPVVDQEGPFKVTLEAASPDKNLCHSSTSLRAGSSDSPSASLRISAAGSHSPQ